MAAQRAPGSQLCLGKDRKNVFVFSGVPLPFSKLQSEALYCMLHARCVPVTFHSKRQPYVSI